MQQSPLAVHASPSGRHGEGSHRLEYGSHALSQHWAFELQPMPFCKQVSQVPWSSSQMWLQQSLSTPHMPPTGAQVGGSQSPLLHCWLQH